MRTPSYPLPCLLLVVLSGMLMAPAQLFGADDNKTGVEGTWVGDLTVGAQELKIVFELQETENGKVVGTLRSPSQGDFAVPLTSVYVTGREIDIAVDMLKGRYQGKLTGAGDRMRGEWTQNDYTFPLELVYAAEGWSYERPQTPVAPFPYRSEEVTFENSLGKNTLAGTLTLPETITMPVPAVVLLTGSGPQDRDETIVGHKPFAVIADYLTRRGIAVLRYDDRGVGKSTGSFENATHLEFATDAWAAVEYLKTRKEISPTQIGLLGHSEGAIVAPLVATKREDVAFLVLLAGPGVPGSEVLLDQSRRIGQMSGLKPETLDLVERLVTAIYDSIVANPEDLAQIAELGAKLKTEIEALPEDEKKKFGNIELTIGQQLKFLESPWFRQFITHDPGPVLEKVTCAVLALNGSLDLQVHAATNLKAIEEHLAKGGNNQLTTREMSGLNHLFQTTKTGSPLEYATLEETFSPTALRVIGEWIEKTVGP